MRDASIVPLQRIEFIVQHPHTVSGMRANCQVRCLGVGLAIGFYPVEHPKTTIKKVRVKNQEPGIKIFRDAFQSWFMSLDPWLLQTTVHPGYPLYELCHWW